MALRTGCGSSPTTRPPTTGSTTSSRTRRSGSSSTTSGRSPTRRTSIAGLHHAWEDGYVPVNRAFADAALAELERSPTPRSSSTTTTSTSRRGSCARLGPDAPLAHFVHIPWPEPNLWRVLPEPIRHAIHDGLLANDVVGFHAHRWRRSFLRSSRDLLDADCDFDRSICSHDGGRTFVAARPISVDPAEFEELADGDEVRRLESGARVGTGPRSSCSASTARIRRRTSSAGSVRSSSTSTRIPRCTVASGCSRCSIPRGRTSRSTRSTSARSSGRRGR